VCLGTPYKSVGVEESGRVKEALLGHVRHRYRTFQNFRPISVAAEPVDERKRVGGEGAVGSQQGSS
jgi:hypothetical protein